MKGRGQNIPLVTDTGSGLCTKAFYKAQSCTRLCRSPNSNGAGNAHRRRPGTAKFDEVKWDFPSPTLTEQVTHTGEGLVQPKFDEVKWVFHQLLGLKNAM